MQKHSSAMPDMEFVKNNLVNDQKIPEFKVSTALGSIFMDFNIQYSELYIFSCSTDLMLSDQVPPGTVSFSCRILANSPSSAPFFPLGWVRNHHSQALGFFPPSLPPIPNTTCSCSGQMRRGIQVLNKQPLPQ